MGVRILHDTQADSAVMYCSTTDWAFGPVVGENADLHKDPSNGWKRSSNGWAWMPGR